MPVGRAVSEACRAYCGKPSAASIAEQNPLATAERGPCVSAVTRGPGMATISISLFRQARGACNRGVPASRANRARDRQVDRETGLCWSSGFGRGTWKAGPFARPFLHGLFGIADMHLVRRAGAIGLKMKGEHKL